MPISTNAPMNANASAVPKVLPIAKIPIKKTGMLRTKADASGKSAAGRQPPRRFRNQNKDGAYASEKSSAAMTSEVMVAPLMSAALRLSPSTTTNVTGWPRGQATTSQGRWLSVSLRHIGRGESHPRRPLRAEARSTPGSGFCPFRWAASGRTRARFRPGSFLALLPGGYEYSNLEPEPYMALTRSSFAPVSSKTSHC